MAGPLLPAQVQAVTLNVAAAVSSTVTKAITVTNAGDSLILAVVNTSQTGANSFAAKTVSGAGATWYCTGAVNNNDATVGTPEIWYGVNASAGSQTVTITTPGATDSVGCQLEEWQYLDASQSALGAAGGTTGNTGSPLIITGPANLGDLVYVICLTANAQTANPASPFTTEVGPTISGVQKAGIAYWVANTVSGVAPTWTQSSGHAALASIVLRAQQPTGNVIWNDPAAQSNAGVLTQQARPDYLDSVITQLGHANTGVLTGCAVSPNTGTDLKFQVSVGTVLFNGGPLAVASASAQVITAADSTNPRKDLVYVDQAGTIHYLAGTANAIPCLPLPPIFPFVALAEIDVPANATQLDATTSTAQAHVTDKRINVGFSHSFRDYYLKPTAALLPPTVDQTPTVFSPNTQDLYLTAIALPANLQIGHIAFQSGSQAASVPTNWWFGIYDSNLNQLALTADQTSTAWAANTVKSLAIATTAQGSQSTFTTTYTGLHYLGFMMKATTVVNLACGAAESATSGRLILTPLLTGLSDTTQTTPPAFPHVATSITTAGNRIFAYVAA